MKTLAAASLSIGLSLALLSPTIAAQSGPAVWTGSAPLPAGAAPSPAASALVSGSAPQGSADGEPAPDGYTNNRLSALQDGSSRPAWIYGSEIYRGVTPNEVDSLPHIAGSQQRAETGENTLTWVGFQPFDTHTRVFLQTGRTAQYQVQESPDGLTVTVRLRDTRVDFSNFHRWIDASYFGRPVHMIDTARADDGVTEVTIDLSRYAAYTVSSEDGYLFLDFTE